MSPTHRRGNLLAIFYYRTPEARDRRIAKIIEDRLTFAERNQEGKNSHRNLLGAGFCVIEALLMDRVSLRPGGTATLACPEPAERGCALRFSLCRGTIYRALSLVRCKRPPSEAGRSSLM